MTIIEMHELCDLLIDKANSPWFTSEEKDKFLNLAHAEFAESRYRKFELDERVRKELLPLVRKSVGSGVTEINYDAIADYMFTLSVRGEFKKKCGNGTKWAKVSPIQLDDEAENQNDPYNLNDNENPGYTEGNNGTNNVMYIVSTDAPVNYILKYLKSPKIVLRDENTPSNNVNSEMPKFTHEEICNIAVRMMLANTEQQLNYQLHNNEINNQN